MLQTPPLSSVLLAEHSPILCPPLLPGLLCPDRAVRFAISASALFPLPCLSSLSSLLIPIAAFPSSALLAVQQLLYFFDRGCQSIRAGCAHRAGGEPWRRRAGAERSGAETTHPCPHPPQSPNGVVMTERRRKSRRGGSDAPVAAVAPETNTARYCESVIFRL